ncbi:hypothetical protein JVT61DRAFT_12223 [Boletus reticuloceps]|uniref:Zn(2)-C6 fungal-type domain-containing protein n=1 Tax=Boletus reticuloceps TaxID=495285 RepID=A0A8I2YE98_9AGAM|nr:hypothetical protein JVT61DRAFT_12223 [Boletus reticuloceps]
MALPRQVKVRRLPRGEEAAEFRRLFRLARNARQKKKKKKSPDAVVKGPNVVRERSSSAMMTTTVVTFPVPVRQNVPTPKVCEACRSRGFDCVWPAVDQSTSASQNEKRACTRCASQKTRCYITGVFSIRRPRGKAAASQPNPLQDTVAKQQQEISEVKEQMKKLATKLVVHEQEKAQLLSSVSALQATVAQMSLKLSSGP